jgi:hypothetical protein
MMSPGSIAVKAKAFRVFPVVSWGGWAIRKSAILKPKASVSPRLLLKKGNKKAPALPRPNLATFWNDLLVDRLNCLKLLYGAFLPCFLAALLLGDPFLSWVFF